MKKLLFSLLLFSFSICVFGQKAKIRSKHVKVEYSSLPKHKVEPGTYKVNITGGGEYNREVIEDDIKLRGWSRVESGDADVKVKVSVLGFNKGKGERKTDTQTTKQKDGSKKTTKYYTYTSTSTGKGSMRIWGPTNAYKAPAKKKKTKKTKKKKAPKKKKEDENPFLAGVDLDVDDDEPTSSSSDKPAGFYDMSKNYTFTTEKSTSSKKAYEEFYGGVSARNDRDYNDFYENIGKRASFQLNDFYGYNKKTSWVRFKRLKSKKHPEFKMFNNATDGLVAIFKTKRFNKANDDVAAKLSPIMDYFQSICDKYGKDDKNQKRLKSAAMYNMAQAYLWLDMPDKALAIGKDFTRWGHDTKYGDYFTEQSESLSHLLAFHGVGGRYYVTEEDPDDVWTEDIGDAPVDDN